LLRLPTVKQASVPLPPRAAIALDACAKASAPEHGGAGEGNYIPLLPDIFNNLICYYFISIGLTLPSLSKREGNYILLLTNTLYNLICYYFISISLTPAYRQAGFRPSPRERETTSYF
jgi:hypothetical protein